MDNKHGLCPHCSQMMSGSFPMLGSKCTCADKPPKNIIVMGSRAAALHALTRENAELRAKLAAAEKARDEARARVDALEADAMKAMHEASVLRRLEYNQVGSTGQVEAVVRSPFMWILGEWIAADFKANGGTNYVEQELKLTIADRSEDQVYTVLVQKAGAKTPAQVAGELRQALDEQAEAVRVLAKYVRLGEIAWDNNLLMWDAGEQQGSFPDLPRQLEAAEKAVANNPTAAAAVTEAAVKEAGQ
jgi:hypothetical protein